MIHNNYIYDYIKERTYLIYDKKFQKPLNYLNNLNNLNNLKGGSYKNINIDNISYINKEIIYLLKIINLDNLSKQKIINKLRHYNKLFNILIRTIMYIDYFNNANLGEENKVFSLETIKELVHKRVILMEKISKLEIKFNNIINLLNNNLNKFDNNTNNINNNFTKLF